MNTKRTNAGDNSVSVNRRSAKSVLHQVLLENTRGSVVAAGKEDVASDDETSGRPSTKPRMRGQLDPAVFFREIFPKLTYV